MVKNSPANAGHVGIRDIDPRVMGSIPGSGRSPGGGHGNSLQYSSLENPWTEGPGRLQSRGLQSQTQLKQLRKESTCYGHSKQSPVDA